MTLVHRIGNQQKWSSIVDPYGVIYGISSLLWTCLWWLSKSSCLALYKHQKATINHDRSPVGLAHHKSCKVQSSVWIRIESGCNISRCAESPAMLCWPFWVFITKRVTVLFQLLKSVKLSSRCMACSKRQKDLQKHVFIVLESDYDYTNIFLSGHCYTLDDQETYWISAICNFLNLITVMAFIR